MYTCTCITYTNTYTDNGICAQATDAVEAAWKRVCPNKLVEEGARISGILVRTAAEASFAKAHSVKYALPVYSVNAFVPWPSFRQSCTYDNTSDRDRKEHKESESTPIAAFCTCTSLHTILIACTFLREHTHGWEQDGASSCCLTHFMKQPLALLCLFAYAAAHTRHHLVMTPRTLQACAQIADLQSILKAAQEGLSQREGRGRQAEQEGRREGQKQMLMRMAQVDNVCHEPCQSCMRTHAESMS